MSIRNASRGNLRFLHDFLDWMKACQPPHPAIIARVFAYCEFFISSQGDEVFRAS